MSKDFVKNFTSGKIQLIFAMRNTQKKALLGALSLCIELRAAIKGSLADHRTAGAPYVVSFGAKDLMKRPLPNQFSLWHA